MVFRFTMQVWVYRLACIPKHSQYSHSGYSGLQCRFGCTDLPVYQSTHSIHIQGIQVYNSGVGVQTCLYTQTLTVFTLRVFRFMYSHSGIQVWVYRLADKYKALTFSIHIQGIQVYNSGLGVQTCLYIQACIPKPAL